MVVWPWEKIKREKKIHFFRFLLVSSYHPGWTIIRLVQKRQKFQQVYVTLLTHALLGCVFNILVFSLQIVVNL